MKDNRLLVILGGLTAIAIALIFLVPVAGFIAAIVLLAIVPPWGRGRIERFIISSIVILALIAVIYPRASSMPIDSVTARLTLTGILLGTWALRLIPRLRYVPVSAPTLVEAMLLGLFIVDQHVPATSGASFISLPVEAAKTRHSGRLRIGVATPWGSQPTGVADFSVATISALANLVDVTVFTTSGGMTNSQLTGLTGVDIDVKNVDELLGKRGEHSFDVIVVVVGNSHFHLPFLELTTLTDCIVIAHDTRMVEFYLALRDRGGVEQVMLKTLDPNAPTTISPPLDEQIDDMRLLQNAGMWEVARRSQGLVLHAQSAAQRLAIETGVTPFLLPFANQRVPASSVITADMRSEARARLGFDSTCIHLASFGYVDTRTKMSDQVIQAAGWLSQWGHKVSLHLVGSASESVIESLSAAALSAGIHEFCVTGFVSEEEFRDYLLAVDLGVQLRISPQLGVSGPLSDLAAFGTRAVASSGLAIDVDAPGYIHRLPENVSALLVAEAIETVLESDFDSSSIEPERIAYLAGKQPELYAEKLLDYLKTIAEVR